MKNPRIYQPTTLKIGHTISLDESGSRHIGKVLRMQVGDSLRVFNGKGGVYQGEITEARKNNVSVKLIEFTEDNKASPLDIHLAQVISRGDRMDYAIQKAVELGVRYITPLTSSRCEVKLNPQRMEKRLHQWQQQVVSACEQCGLNIVPIVNPCITVDKFCITANAERKIILHPGPKNPQQYFAAGRPQQTVVLIGPEGGFDDNEIGLAKEHGFDCLALGPRVFRTETAPVVMLTLLQHYWGDL